MYREIPDGCSKHCYSRVEQAKTSAMTTVGIMGAATIGGIIPLGIIAACAMGGVVGFFIAVGILTSLPALAWTLMYATAQDRHFH